MLDECSSEEMTLQLVFELVNRRQIVSQMGGRLF